jgi:colanic acid/amylovoran biosynthesis glycosyltransferase
MIKSPLNVHFMRQFLKRERIDLVFANYGITGGAIAPLCEELGIKLIVHFHGADASVRKYYEDPQYNYRGLFSTAHAIVVVSGAMREQLGLLGADARKLRLVPYSPDEKFFEVQPSYANQRCVAIGRFAEKKAPYLTLLAFKKAQQEVPGLTLRMIGTGELLPVCKRMTESLHITSVEFIGVQTPEQVREHLAGSLMFIQHSVVADNGDQEGTPVAILEASAAALPVIATRHAGIPEVVQDGESGFLVDEGDVDKMAECIIRISRDPGLARMMGEAGRALVRKKYSGEQYRKAITELVEEVVNGD